MTKDNVTSCAPAITSLSTIKLRLISVPLLLLTIRTQLGLLQLITPVSAASHVIPKGLETNSIPSSDDESITVEIYDILPYLDACPSFRRYMDKYFCDETLASCRNRCGRPLAEDTGCACDAMCPVYGDCCDDYLEECPSQELLGPGWGIPLEAFHDVEVTCWNGRYVISGKGSNNDTDIDNDLRKPLVSQGEYLHFINMAAYKSVNERPIHTMRGRMRQSLHDAIQWGRSIYVHASQNVSLEQVQDFINTGRMGELGIQRLRSHMTVIDHPPEGVVERACQEWYHYNNSGVVCDEDRISKSCNLPKTFFFKLPKTFNCSSGNKKYLYDDTNNPREFDDNQEENDNRKLLDKNQLNKINHESTTVKRDDMDNNHDILGPNRLKNRANFGETSSYDPTMGKSSRTTPRNSQDFELSQDKSVLTSHAYSRQTTKSPDRFSASPFAGKSSSISFINPRGLSIQFPENSHFVNKNSKSITFFDSPASTFEPTLSNTIGTQESSSASDHFINDRPQNTDDNRCWIQPTQKSLQKVPARNVPFIKVEFEPEKIGALTQIFVENINSSMERLVCNTSSHSGDSDFCHLSVSCKPGYIPLGLQCAPPSKLIVETFGSRNLSLQRTAIFAIFSSLVNNFSDTFIVPPNWISDMSLNLYSFPHAASMRNVLPMSRWSSLRYDGKSLPIRHHIRGIIDAHFSGIVNQQRQQQQQQVEQQVIRSITVCVAVEKVSNFPDWVVCDRWYFDIDNNVNCTEHIRVQGNDLPPVARRITSKTCLADALNSYAYSGSPGESRNKTRAFLILGLLFYLCFQNRF